jgi:hypothetical protein
LAEIGLNGVLGIWLIGKVGAPGRALFLQGGREIPFEDVRAMGILRDLQNKSPQMTE